MMKSAKLAAISFALLLIFVGRQMVPYCDAANAQSSWRTKSRNGSIFFPYGWCLAFKILSVSPHTTHESKADHADLDVKVKVEYVIREGTQTNEFTEYDRFDNQKKTAVRAGDTVTLCLSKESNLDLKQFIDSLHGRTQVWAFSTWHGYDHNNRLFFPIDERFEPFHNKDFSPKDLKELKADLSKIVTNPQEAKVPIERYLRERWPESRIREFCHKDNRLIMWQADPDPAQFKYKDCPKDFNLRGILYPQSALGEVMWQASTANKIPTSYSLIIRRKKSIWQLEKSNFQLGSSFNDDDALKKRIHDTLSYALDTSFQAYERTAKTEEEASFQGVYSDTPLSILPDWRTFTIERVNDTGLVMAVTCETSSGRLRALLDTNKEIQTVTVNGKQIDEWLEALAGANEKRSQLYDQ